MAKITKTLTLLFLTLFICSCTKDKLRHCHTELELSEIIIGQWELIEQWGFPYSSSEWSPVVNTNVVIEFLEGGQFIFNNFEGITNGVYQVIDSLKIIQITTNLDYTLEIQEYNSCEFYYEFPTIEGINKLKYRRLN